MKKKQRWLELKRAIEEHKKFRKYQKVVILKEYEAFIKPLIEKG